MKPSTKNEPRTKNNRKKLKHWGNRKLVFFFFFLFTKLSYCFTDNGSFVKKKKLIFYCLIVLVFFLIFFHFRSLFCSWQVQVNLILQNYLRTEFIQKYSRSIDFQYEGTSFKDHTDLITRWSEWSIKISIQNFFISYSHIELVFLIRNFQLANNLYHMQYLKRSIPSNSNLLNSMRGKKNRSLPSWTGQVTT